MMTIERIEELKRICARKIREDREWESGEPMPQQLSDYWNDLLTLIDSEIQRQKVSNVERWQAISDLVDLKIIIKSRHMMKSMDDDFDPADIAVYKSQFASLGLAITALEQMKGVQHE